MSNTKLELALEPVDGELLQPVGKIPTITAEQMKVIAVIQSVSKVDVLANVEETAAGIVKMKSSYLPIVELAKTEIANAETQADFNRAKERRLAIRSERLSFTKTINAELAARKLIIDTAKKGKENVEEAFESLEAELNEVEKPVDERLKAAAAAKKALSDAIAKLKSHTINPLLSAADIETAIDDFRLSFGDANYQGSQSVAESIFESKVAEFETILSAAVLREENERKVKEQEEQAKQRASINVTFPLAEISGYGNRTAADIQACIDWTTKVDMTAFDLVLTEAKTAKQSCLNMLNAFLPMAVARDAENERVRIEKQNLADRIEVQRLEREATKKQYQDDWDEALLDYEVFKIGLSLPPIKELQVALDNDSEYQAAVSKAFIEVDIVKTIEKLQTEPAVIAVINDDAAFIEDVTKIIGEPLEVLSDVNEDDCVAIPVKYLKALISVAEIADENGLLEEDIEYKAIKFAKSII